MKKEIRKNGNIFVYKKDVLIEIINDNGSKVSIKSDVYYEDGEYLIVHNKYNEYKLYVLSNLEGYNTILQKYNNTKIFSDNDKKYIFIIFRSVLLEMCKYDDVKLYSNDNERITLLSIQTTNYIYLYNLQTDKYCDKFKSLESIIDYDNILVVNAENQYEIINSDFNSVYTDINININKKIDWINKKNYKINDKIITQLYYGRFVDLKDFVIINGKLLNICESDIEYIDVENELIKINYIIPYIINFDGCYVEENQIKKLIINNLNK